MDDELKRIWKLERDGLSAEVRLGGCLPLVAAANIDIISHVPDLLRRQAPVEIAALSEQARDVYVASCPKLSYKSLWVPADDRGYAHHYLTFLCTHWGMEIKGIPKPYNVDHMFNQKRALKYGYRYLRLALVNGPVNQSHGSGYEKTVTRSRRERGDLSRALMDEIGCMKFFGFMNPNISTPRQPEIDAYARFAALEFGMSESGVKENITTLLKVAAFFKT